MKKAFITLAAALPLTIAAQFFSSPNQQLIKDAVDGGIIVVEQSYQLEDTVSGQRFGRFGNKEFGKSYTLAVLTDSGYCLAPAALRPWDSDPNFEKYSKTHKPVLYKTAWRHFNDSVFSELDADLAAAVALNDGYAFVKSAGNQPTLAKDDATGRKNGWAVWVVSEDSLAASPATVEVSYQPVRREIEVVDSATSYVIEKPFTDKKLWGGIYVVPVRKSLGNIEFEVVGVIEPGENDTWRVATPFNRHKAADDIVPEGGNELTPLKATAAE